MNFTMLWIFIVFCREPNESPNKRRSHRSLTQYTKTTTSATSTKTELNLYRILCVSMSEKVIIECQWWRQPYEILWNWAEMESVIVKAFQLLIFYQKLAHILHSSFYSVLFFLINRISWFVLFISFSSFRFDCCQTYWRNCKSHRQEYIL